MCYVEGIQNDTYVPLLPVRHDNKLIFPIGLIKGYYTHLELREAQKHGFTINKLGNGVIYTKTFKLFKSFVIDKYKTRLEQKANKDLF